MRKQQANALQAGSEFTAITRWQWRQEGLARGGRVILLLAEFHIVAAHAQLLHHHVFITLELCIRRQPRTVQSQHFFSIDPNASSLLRLVPLVVSAASARSFSDDCPVG